MSFFDRSPQLRGIPIVKEDVPKRDIVTPKRGKDGLTVQPKDVGPEREQVENKNRERFAGHFNFADPLTGRANTVDEKGDYNCGRCNQEHAGKCLLLNTGKGRTPLKIDEDAGSCEDWEIKDAADTEMQLNEKSVDSANYGVAKNGKGFGCHRCPWASRAFEPDSQGRDLYCGKGDFRTFGYACCALNGAPVK